MKTRFPSLAILPFLMAGSAFAQMPNHAPKRLDGGRRIPPMFAKADLDRDGFLTFAEMQKQAEIRFLRMDSSKDGRVSVEEFRKSAKKTMKNRFGKGRRGLGTGWEKGRMKNAFSPERSHQNWNGHIQNYPARP